MSETVKVKVKISFDYYPDEPDPDDATGMSEDEHLRIMDALVHLGADDIQIERAR